MDGDDGEVTCGDVRRLGGVAAAAAASGSSTAVAAVWLEAGRLDPSDHGGFGLLLGGVAASG